MAGSTVVVVDDDRDFQELLDTLLTDEGYQVWGSARTTEVLTLVQQYQPCLLIPDLHVERVAAGLLLLHQLRQGPATASLPVLVVTAGAATLRQHADWLRAQGVSMLIKPFDLDELLAQVRALTGPPPEQPGQ
jgi:two-component system OmpR family response regulator